MNRYALISTKFPREIILLQGTGCRWKKCTFCDYHTDISSDPFVINQKTLEKVTGKYGVLDIINSGSGIELDKKTIHFIQQICKEKQIHTLWFEMHWMYRHQLQKFANLFAPTKVKFRCGIETFDSQLRNSWNKGIDSEIDAKKVAKYFDGICLLICTENGSKQQIENDIQQSESFFEYFSINIFCENNTHVKSDKSLKKWFLNDLYPTLKNHPKCEILIDNGDLGVGK